MTTRNSPPNNAPENPRKAPEQQGSHQQQSPQQGQNTQQKRPQQQQQADDNLGSDQLRDERSPAQREAEASKRDINRIIPEPMPDGWTARDS
ncbi:hypothetical protein [Hydrocarboniphaga sp.]|uniref:hypothetical protein n=1 Tax=Hydrocarboniphaga sp. TaxID=2033016 RepID=UPI003D0A88C6